MGLITVHLAPTQIIAALSIEFDDKPNTCAIEDLMERLEERQRGVPGSRGPLHQAADSGTPSELRSRRFGGRCGRATERGCDPINHPQQHPVARPQRAQCCGAGAKPLKGDARRGLAIDETTCRSTTQIGLTKAIDRRPFASVNGRGHWPWARGLPMISSRFPQGARYVQRFRTGHSPPTQKLTPVPLKLLP